MPPPAGVVVRPISRLHSVPRYGPRLRRVANQLRPTPATSPSPTLRIGQLATRADVSVETLRFYERAGLLERPYQHLSGYRAYPAAEVERVRTIKRAQALGFRLAEIRDLLQSAPAGQVSERAAQKLQEIDASITQLVLARQELALLVAYHCDRLLGCSCGQSDCPVHTGAGASAPGDQAPSAARPMVGRTKSGFLAGGVAAAAGAICCAPLVGGLLAALGIPALTVGAGTEIGLAGAAAAATGLGVVKFRRRRLRPGPGETK